MKKFSILFVSVLFLSGGCSDLEPVVPTETTERAVGVGFRLEAVDTDTSLQPMTRARTSYKEYFYNMARVLILKKSDTRWIVDGTHTIQLDANSAMWDELKITDALPPCSFGLELRPGDYRLVAVLNPRSATWNEELIPGKVVADASDASLRTPPLLTYAIATHFMNNGYRMLNREIFVAVADFTVPKSSDLQSAPMPAVPLRAQRRVGKFRVLLKDQRSPVENFSFDLTAHKVTMVFKSKEKPFAEGIDALGGMYYSDAGLYELPWCLSTAGEFHQSGESPYQLCQTNSTVFSPFLFADPEAGDLSFEVSDIKIAGSSEGYLYKTDEVFTRTLAASKITGIVFRTTDTYGVESSRPLIDVVEATDQDGKPESAATLFDPFYEWNAMYDY